MNSEVKEQKSRIDWMITLMPLAIIVALCVVFFVAPDQSNAVLSKVRFFFGDTFGTYYLIIGLGVFLVSWYIAFSKYGNIVLGGKMDKPQYALFIPIHCSMDLKVSVYLQKSASTCSLDYWHTFSCLVVRQDTSSIQVSNHSEEWYRTLLDFPRLLIRRELQVSHRTGQSTIGHTGWYGV